MEIGNSDQSPLEAASVSCIFVFRFNSMLVWADFISNVNPKRNAATEESNAEFFYISHNKLRQRRIFASSSRVVESVDFKLSWLIN